jgi:hypothetical protein
MAAAGPVNLTWSHVTSVSKATGACCGGFAQPHEKHFRPPRLSTCGDARCTVLLGLSTPTNARLCVSCRLGWRRHVTEPSERGLSASSAIGYVAMGWVAASRRRDTKVRQMPDDTK